jgi:tetratricopeptide (TPR) repeat protein
MKRNYETRENNETREKYRLVFFACFVIFACFVVSTPLAAQIASELNERVAAGLKAKKQNDLETAIREFKRVVELAPNLPAAHMNLGAVYFEKRDYDKAIPALRKALELNPELIGAHELLGAALAARGYWADAIPSLEKAQVPELLGVALLETGRVREAIDRLESALEKRPEDPDLLYYLGQAYGRLSKQFVDRLVGHGVDTARKEQLLGEAAAETGKRDAAEKHFRAALEKRADLQGVHLAIGELYLTSGDYANAEREFREELRLTPGAAITHYKLGATLLERGRLEESLAELKLADRLRPEMPETLLELAKATAAAGDSRAAESLFQKVISLEKTSELARIAHFQLAQLYRKLGRTADAERELQLFQTIRRRKD